MVSRVAARTWRRRWRPGCLVVAVALAPAVLGSAPAAAQPGDATITPATASPGATVTIAGGGCRRRGPDPSVVRVVAEALGVDAEVPTAADGSWTLDLVVGDMAPAGPSTITVTCVRKPAPEAYTPLSLTVLAPNPPSTTAPASSGAPGPASTAVATTVGGGSAPSSTLNGAAPTPAGAGNAPTRDAPAATGRPAIDAPDETEGPSVTDEPQAASSRERSAPTARVAREVPDVDSARSGLSPRTVALSIAGGALALLAGAVFVRRRGQDDHPPADVTAPVELEVPAEPDGSIGAVPEAEDPHASPPAPAPRPAPPPRLGTQVTDVARTMAVLEPVLRAAAPPDVTFLLDATTDRLTSPLGPHELEALVVPLVEHAVAPAHGGTIRIVVGRGPCPADPDIDWALVVVAGTGPGSAPDAASALLDLDPVRESVVAAGGHLEVTSVPRHGTTVTIALPLVDAPGADPAQDGAVSVS